jgi:hypothetical protein
MVGAICCRVAAAPTGPIQVNTPKPAKKSCFCPQVSKEDIIIL